MADTNINVKLLQGTEAKMAGASAPEKVDGQLYFATIDEGTKGYIYLDSNGKRFSFGKHAETAGYATEAGAAEQANKAVTANFAKNGIYYIEGDSSSTAGHWVGKNTDITEYYNGLTIAYKIPIAGGSSKTYLKINILDEVEVVKNATTVVKTTEYPVNSIIILTYTKDGSTAYWKIADYNTNTDTKIRQYVTTTNDSYPLLFTYKTRNNVPTSSYEANYGRFNSSIYVNPSLGKINATEFEGTLKGTADKAKEFAEATTVSLTGDATGTSQTSTRGWTVPVEVLQAAKLKTARKIDGISFNGEADINRYAICSTTGDTVAKTASILSGTFNLVEGARVTVKFTYANTVANPTLNINNTGAKQIYVGGSALSEGQWWKSGAIIDFTYNGEFWVLTSGAGSGGGAYWANIQTSHLSNENTKPTFNPEFKVYLPNNTVIPGTAGMAYASPIGKYLWHDLFAFGVNGYPTVTTSSNGGSSWTTSTNTDYTHKPFIKKENQSITVLKDGQTAIRWQWFNNQFHACQAKFLNIGFTYQASVGTFNITFETSKDGTTWTKGFEKTGCKYNQTPYWFYLTSSWSSEPYVRLTFTRTSSTGSVGISGIKLLTSRWGDQGKGSEYEYPYSWDIDQNIFPKNNNTSNLGTSSNKWKNVYATTFYGNLSGNASSADQATTAGKANEFSSAATIKLQGDATGEASSVKGWTIDVDVNQATHADKADIWTTAQNFSITDGTNVGNPTSVNGSEAVSLKLPAIIQATLNGNADSATQAGKLTTARKFTIGDTGKDFNGESALTWTPSEIGYRHEWDAIVKGQTWSRLCHVALKDNTVGTSYLLNIAATRNSVVYNDTFLIKTNHQGTAETRGKIIKISGSEYTTGYSIRLLTNGSGVSYIELNDNAASIASSTTQVVRCRLIPIYTGVVTKYTTFTSGATLPTDFAVTQTMTLTTADIQANVEGSFKGNLDGNATSATQATSAGKANEFSQDTTVKLTGDVTGEATSRRGWEIATTVKDDSHNHQQLTGWTDGSAANRNNPTTPNEYNLKFWPRGIKTKTAIGETDGSTYTSIIGYRGWSDSSGGDAYELGFTQNGNIFVRHGATDTWGNWDRIPTTGTNNIFSGLNTFNGGIKANEIEVGGNLTVINKTELKGALEVTGASTFTGLITANGGINGNVTGNLTGNADTATEADKAKKWSATKAFKVADNSGENAGAAVNVDGTANVTLKMPLTFKGDHTIDGNLSISGNTSTSGNVTLNGSGKTFTSNIDSKFIKQIKGNISAAHSSVTGGANGYHLISIVPTSNWMLAFTIRVYQAYTYTDIVVSGYNYSSTQTWYSPKATIIGTNGTQTMDVVFGCSAANKLWVAIPASNYYGIDILNVTNGYTQITDYSNLFTLSLVSTLPTSTPVAATTVKAYAPWYRGETITTANGGTGNTSFTANRLLYSESATKLSSSGHYSSANKVAINSTEIDEALAFYVSGNSKISGELNVTGNVDFDNNLNVDRLITQGGPTSNTSIDAMNKFKTDLFVEGSGVAPNAPSVPGFYLGKSENDGNRHMDIVSGENVSYIDFNKAAHATDFDFRIHANVSNGLVDFQWGSHSDLTDKRLKINGLTEITGKLTAAGKIIVPTTGGQWITGKTTSNASIQISTKQTEDKYYPILGVTTSGDHVFNLGGLGNKVGVYGYYASRTLNGTDFSTTWDVSSGLLVHTAEARIEGSLTVSKNTDLEGTKNNSPALIVGGLATAAHLELDSDELQAKANGTSVAALYLNKDGGQVNIGAGGLNVTGNTVLGDSAANDTLVVNAKSTLNNTLTVTAGGAQITGNSKITGGLEVTGATTLSSTLGVAGATTINNNLTVTGNTVLGDSTADSTTIYGPLSKLSGHIYLDGAADGSTSNTTQVIFRKGSTEHIAISSNDDCFVVNPTSGSTSNQIALYLGDKSNSTSTLPSKLQAPRFIGPLTGNVTGNADTATALTTSAGGSDTPVYFSDGKPVACSVYAGGTAITLNGLSKTASTASFYAPTEGGESGEVLVGTGATSEPEWKTLENANIMDLTSAQTATGVKTFENGIIIGTENSNVILTYDTDEGALRFTFVTE